MARVLVVGGDADLLELYSSWLARAGHHVEVRSARPQRADHLAAEPFDVVVVDGDPAGRTWSAVVLAIRALPGHGDVPVIMLTTDATPQDVAELRAAGAHERLDKPFPLRCLTALVERCAAGRPG